MKTKLLLSFIFCTVALGTYAVTPPPCQGGCSFTSNNPTPGSNNGSIAITYPACATVIILREGFGNGGNIIATVNLAGQPNPYTFNGLAGGNYHYDVNSSGGQCNSNVSLSAPPCNLSATVTAGGPTSFCPGGSVILSSNTGNSYNYLWSNGATTSSTTVSAGGSYYITISQGNNGQCAATSNVIVVTVYPNEVPQITPDGDTEFCEGGSVNLTSSAGSAYSWTNGATDQTINVSTSGDYSVTVTNEFGCVNTSAATTVTVNPTPDAEVLPDGPTEFCDGGSVTLSANSGDGYSYLWSNGSEEQSITVSESGDYSVTVTNEYGCSATSETLTVTVYPNPSGDVEASGPLAFCDGGSVDLTAVASGDGYSYSWSNGAITQSITVSAGGTYSVTVTSDHGCSTTSSDYTVTVWSNPVVFLGSPITLFYGYAPNESVTIEPTIGGGAAPYEVSWSPSQTITATEDNVGTSVVVTATVTDANGCTGSGSVTVSFVDARCGHNNDKVLVCHLPPDNPANAHTICVGASAVADHLSHGDYLGECSGSGKTDEDDDEGTIASTDYFESTMSVYPNPFVDGLNFTMQLPSNTKVTVIIYDSKGTQVAMPYNGSVSGQFNLRWNASELATGVYIAKVITPEQVFVELNSFTLYSLHKSA